jgi:hypothetical protein
MRLIYTPSIHQSRPSDHIQLIKFAALSSATAAAPVPNQLLPDLSPPPRSTDHIYYL